MENNFPLNPERSRRLFLELIRKHGDRFYNFAFRLRGNEADAKDTVQEALTRAYRNFDKYDPKRPFETWVFRIIHNIFLDHVRRYERKHTVSMDAPSSLEDVRWSDILPGNDENPLDRMIRREEEEMLQDALRTLPPDYRTAVTLCDIEDISYEAISEIMECPLGTVRSRIHQGRLLLRKAVEWKQKKGEIGSHGKP